MLRRQLRGYAIHVRVQLNHLTMVKSHGEGEPVAGYTVPNSRAGSYFRCQICQSALANSSGSQSSKMGLDDRPRSCRQHTCPDMRPNGVGCLCGLVA